MESLARHLGLPTDRSWNGPVDLYVDDFPVTLEPYDGPASEEIWIHMPLSVVPEEREVEIYRVLLEGNLFWSGTADATIGVNSQTREATLAYRMAIDGLDARRLTEVVAQFVEVAGAWRDYLTSSAPADDQLPPAGQLLADFSPGMIRA